MCKLQQSYCFALVLTMAVYNIMSINKIFQLVVNEDDMIFEILNDVVDIDKQNKKVELNPTRTQKNNRMQLEESKQKNDSISNFTLKHINYFFIHIPKTAGCSMRNKMNHLARSENWMMCDYSSLGFERISRRKKTHYKDKRRCHIHMSEVTYNLELKRIITYTMVRPPQEHVLSQYFHCT